MDPSAPRSAAPRIRNAVALAAAALLAIGTVLASIREHGWSDQPDPVALVDEDLADLRLQLRAGERIGVVVPPLEAGSDLAFWYSAQYALAPALVEPIMVGDCVTPEPGPRCRLTGATRVAMLREDTATFALLQFRLGLVPVGTVGRAVILVRAAR